MTVMKATDLLRGLDTHANRPAANAVPKGALYPCSDHAVIYQSDGTTWNDWDAFGSGGTLTVQDENGNVATGVTQIDFQGAGVDASAGTGEVIVAITGGGGGSSIESNQQTSDYTLVLDDAGKVIEMTAATALNLTVPPNSSVAFPVGTIIEVYQGGAGTVSLVQGSGVTIRNNLPLSGQYAEATLRKRATDEWVLAGSLASSTTPLLKDYVEVTRTAGDLTLNQTAITPVSTSLDLTIAAAAGDLIEFGISGIMAAGALPVCFDVYTMPSGSTVNPFGAGLSASIATLQGVPGWEFSSENIVGRLTGGVCRTLVSGDVSGGSTVLRLLYAKSNATARTLFAQTNIPLKVWAKNYGQV